MAKVERVVSQILPEQTTGQAFLTIEDLPWGAGEQDIYFIIQRSAFERQNLEEEVAPVLGKALKQIARQETETVAQWLPKHQKRLDAYTTAYKRLRGRENIYDILRDYVPELIPPVPAIEAQLVVLFRQALHKTRRDPLMVLSDPKGEVSGKLARREVVAVGVVLGELAVVHISPAVGANLGIEDMSHLLFSQLARPSEDLMVLRAKRSRKRVSQPME